jgi:hypothetical protein
MVNWGDVPSWATAGAAFAALIGAGLAYRYQAEQVRLQREQLADQKMATTEQAEVIRRQTTLLERQQADAVDVYARTIDGGGATVLPADDHQEVHMLVVANGSNRPVRQVACKIAAIKADSSVRHERLADVYGWTKAFNLGITTEDQSFVLGERTHTMPLLRAGDEAGFVWGFTLVRYPQLESWAVRFTDDAGLHWEIDTSLSLKRLNARDW